VSGPGPRPMEPFLETGHRDLRDRVDAFVRESLEPAGIDEGAAGSARRVLDLLAGAGLLEHAVPARFGGAAEPIGLRSICVIREALARGSALADAMFVMITEPGAGSDLGAIETTARRDGDGYVLQGVKSFISNAGLATFYTVLARTGQPEDGRDGLAFFLVEAGRPGLRTEPQRLLSPHPIGELHFDGCRVDAESRLGEEGEGFRLAVETLNFFRPSVGAAAVGFADRALDEARDRVSARVQFGRELAKFQGVQFMLADMATGTEAARLLVQRAAAAQDAGAPRPALASMAKLFATENAGRVVDAALQLHGASGLVAGSILERLYREVRALRIYEGTSEIQRSIIAREILRR